ncbi:VC2046/SO_2500 family protein [Psychromonas aquimarina]|uniref:VC2046/SO_2500 family protein n=1 Tax=Psychromonas aquimarina TaxID=444919 RepID=UPI0004138135|nr:VC2046/SO_2500 family protein [Psychromonas aquimarina]
MKQVESGLIINEWQLGQQLNTAVHNGTRDKFNLLLSLLSDDARDFAQFTCRPAEEEVLAEQTIRDSLFLPEGQPLVNKGISLEQAAALNEDLHNNNFTSIRLKQLLNNEALLSRSAAPDIPCDVKENLSFLSQQRLTAAQENTQAGKVEVQRAPGVGADMMELYKTLDLDNKPIKVTYSNAVN